MTVERGTELVEHACAALRAAARAEPIKQLATLVVGEIEQAWPQLPWRVGVRGDTEGRTGFLDVLCNGLLDGQSRLRAVLHVQRGEMSKFRALHDSGRTEELVMLVVPPPPPPRRRAETVDTGGHRAHAVAVELAERRLPAVVRVPPASWAVWAWLWRWILLVLRRREVAEWRALVAARDAARVETASKQALEQVEREEAASTTVQRYRDRLRELSWSASVNQIVIEVADGPLPVDVAVVELVDGSPATPPDVVIEVAQRVAYVRDEHSERTRRIGAAREAAPALTALAKEGRAKRLAWRAVEVLRSAEATLGSEVAAKEAGFRERIAKLDALHVDDRDALITAQLAELRSEVISRTSAFVKHALAHATAELERHDIAWTDKVTEAASLEELQRVVEQIDATSQLALREVVDETRRLVASQMTGSAFDLLPSVVSILVEKHGFPMERVRGLAAAPAAPVPVLRMVADAEGTKLGAVGGSWLTGLFKSYDARRSEVLAKLKLRTSHLRELASAELFDAEPAISAALNGALEKLLAAAIERHAAWLAEALAAEQAQIARDRTTLAPLIRARDATHNDARKLAALIAQQDELPAGATP